MRIILSLFIALVLSYSCKNEGSEVSKVTSTTPAAEPIAEKKHEHPHKEMPKNNTDAKPSLDYSSFGIDIGSVREIGPLEKGSQAPDFTSKDHMGRTFNLDEATQEGDVVIIFYRGYWCPICMNHLGEFSKGFERIKEKGVQLVLVSPESSVYQDSTMAMHKMDAIYISDPESKIMDQYGVGFKVSNSYNKKFENWMKQPLKDFNDQDEAMLPVPATYIITKDRKIRWLHFDPNYRNRSTMADILAYI